MAGVVPGRLGNSRGRPVLRLQKPPLPRQDGDYDDYPNYDP
jgi:hypothetical protein